MIPFWAKPGSALPCLQVGPLHVRPPPHQSLDLSMGALGASSREGLTTRTRPLMERKLAEANPRRVSKTNANENGERNPIQFHRTAMYNQHLVFVSSSGEPGAGCPTPLPPWGAMC
jgi:hypothetical protein